ncbi:Atp-Dependent (S)-Nad(P)H-Hydrate Dehydratase [Manis pentadactyla]|nr:Atp-Dependent (S)-Nad(P)H-Hydrate Dehydratase [Manis pentadactyla]
MQALWSDVISNQLLVLALLLVYCNSTLSNLTCFGYYQIGERSSPPESLAAKHQDSYLHSFILGTGTFAECLSDGDDGAEQATQKDRILFQKEKQMPVLLEVCTLRDIPFALRQNTLYLLTETACLLHSPGC